MDHVFRDFSNEEEEARRVRIEQEILQDMEVDAVAP
jgi:hypothetical protein